MTASPPLRLVPPPDIADSRRRIRHVFVRDLVLDASIGVHTHELSGQQRVRFNLDLAVAEGGDGLGDDLANVVCYEKVITGVRAIVAAGHVNLVETLAEKVADMCLADSRVLSVRVRVEKLDIVADAASVGVEIERHARSV